LLLVNTKLAPSKIDGIGLFAAQKIDGGTVVWRWEPSIDIRLTTEQLELLASPSREQICKYTYREQDTGLYVLCGDDARFFNHSEAPNCLDVCACENGVTIAARDIAEGEELTCDYKLFDRDLVEGKYKI
jgi:SET domain-containing protein